MADGGFVDDHAHCASCEARFGECNCSKCKMSLDLITWYGQVPGNIRSMSILPHLQKSTNFKALLRSRVFFTTALTIKYVQWSLVVLGLAQLCIGFSMLPALPEKLITVSSKCTVARLTPHSLRNGLPVLTSVNATDWSFGLLLNRCTVPGGKLSVLGATRVLSFTQPVQFNGFYLVSHSASELDPLSFTLECLSDGTSILGSDAGAVTLAASGLCGWLAGVKNAVVVNPPPSRWQTVQDHLGEDETRITHDYSRFSCKMPLLFDAASYLLSGSFFLLGGMQSMFFAASGVFGIKYPFHTFLLGNMISSALKIAICFWSWRLDYEDMFLHFGLIFLFFLLFVSEEFPEERMFLFGLYMAALGGWASLTPVEGTTHTAFYARGSFASMTPRCASGT